MPHFVSNRPHGGMTALCKNVTEFAKLTQSVHGGRW